MEAQTEAAADIPNEAEEAAKREAEKQRLAVHQERRSEIGKQFGLDVGTPNETAVLADGKEHAVRDAFGLLMDPTLYASKKCNDCYGRGVVFKVTPLSAQFVKMHLEKQPEDEIYIQQSKPGSYYTRGAQKCACVQRRYDKKRIEFAEALVKADLAVKNMMAKQYELV